MSNKVLMKGNEAIAEAAIMADCRHFFGYPITPQTEISAYMAKRMPKLGGTFLQAESEIAAINMVYGASAAGRRTMTTSSSPGIALKSEGLSYLAGCDLPAVVVNVQRGGPGLGGIQPSQSDYFHATRSAGHGDFRMIVLAPYKIQELLDSTYDAFDLADKYRMTVMVLTDGILGQMMEPVDISPKEDRNLPPKDWAVTGTKGGRKPNIINSLQLQPENLEKENFKRFDKYKSIEESETRHEEYLTEDADIVIAAYGASARIARNAVDDMRREGIKAGLIRPITLWPFPKKAFMELTKRVKGFVVAEMSMGQMIEDVELSIRCSRPVSLCFHAGGIVPQPDEITAEVKKLLASVKGGN